MTHLDLFSGIGGFAYAVDQVFGDVEHVFCDNDKFCQQVIKKHWPEATIYGDIRDIKKSIKADILTGGFPCQPFSQAGQRKGVADDRYLWPEMLRVIRLAQPTWIIAENVSGLLTMQGGVVFEQVCTDLEAAGYEVQPFIIPAAGVAAPHKRDRVWICAHANSPEHSRRGRPGREADSISSLDRAALLPGQSGRTGETVADAPSKGSQGQELSQPSRDSWASKYSGGWESDWSKIAAELCSVDDGLSHELDEFKLSKAGHRNQQIKAYGNAIVPQVAIEIMRGISRA